MKEPIWHRIKRLAYEIPFRLTGPRYVLFMMPYDYEWDLFLEMALTLNMVDTSHPDSGIRATGEHTIMAGEHRVWVENYPYAYGQKLGSGRYYNHVDESGRPSLHTIRRLRKLQLKIMSENKRRT